MPKSLNATAKPEKWPHKGENPCHQELGSLLICGAWVAIKKSFVREKTTTYKLKLNKIQFLLPNRFKH